MGRTVRSGALAMVLLTTAPAAQTPSSPLSFEVASIKRNQSGDEIAEDGFQPGGRINLRNGTLVNMIVAAYAVPPDRIEGGPAWASTDRFDVVATGNRTASVAETRQMMRTLLEDRFKLKTRTEPRDRPLFDLSARQDKRLGAQLKLSSTDCAATATSRESLPPSGPPSVDHPVCGTIGFGGGLLRGHGVTLGQVAGTLSNFAGRPVRDRTGLGELYDFELRWSRSSENLASGDPPELFTAIREQLGLQLEATRGPLDVLVITSADKPVPD
jgi:uncharacterized protein (TIGR03435 family)